MIKIIKQVNGESSLLALEPQTKSRSWIDLRG